MENLLIYTLSGFCIYLMVITHIERMRSERIHKDLLNRIMARDFSDYTVNTVELKQGKEVDEESRLDVLPID